MTLRQIVVSTPKDRLEKVVTAGSRNEVLDLRVFTERQARNRVTVVMLADQDRLQKLMDALQTHLSTAQDWRISLLPVETVLPFPDSGKGEEKAAAEKDASIGGRSREEIYEEVWKQARIDRNYVVFVILSTVVAALGMAADSITVVIGAMVIAPLLGPNLAFSVGVALGDRKLMQRAALTNLAGIALVLVLSLALALVLPMRPDSPELVARTQVGFDGMAVALASGAAAALSLVSGVSSALVGVMVAVALLPPTAAVGLYLGMALPRQALDALLLLAVNVVCVNLAAQVVMLTRGITPRTWHQRRGARQSMLINGAVWLSLLVALAVLLWLRQPGLG